MANGIKRSRDEEHECEEDMWFHVSISEVDVSLDGLMWQGDFIQTLANNLFVSACDSRRPARLFFRPK